MKQHQSIILNIPEPCHEDWNKMQPDECGRYCELCQTKVMDFTQFTDAQLFQYFSKATGNICGRFATHSIGREISQTLPFHRGTYYPTAAALGLTLLLSQPQQSLAKYKPPLVASPVDTVLKKQDSLQTDGEINGRVFDENNVPMIGAIVEVFDDKKMIGGTMTDTDGHYILDHLPRTILSIQILYIGFDTCWIRDINTKNDTLVTVDQHLRKKHYNSDQITLTLGRVCVEPPHQHRLFHWRKHKRNQEK